MNYTIEPEVWSHVEEQLIFHQVTDEDRAILENLSARLRPLLPRIIDHFFDYIQTFPIMNYFQFERASLPELKAVHCKYVEELVAGRFDENFYKCRQKIGNTYAIQGLPPRWHLSIYAFFCKMLFPLIHEIYQKEPDRILTAQTALIKSIFLDIQIASESYIHHYSNELLQVQTALENRLWLEDRLLSLIMNETTDAIVGLDEQDRICTWSQGAQRIFDYKTNEILDKSLTDLVICQDTIQSLKTEARQKGVAVLHGAYWKDRAGTPIDADATITFLIGRQGNPIGSTLIIQDRTEAREMAEKVKGMEQLTAMTKITAGVAHEIRTPLGVIALTSDILKNKVVKILDRCETLVEEEERNDIVEMISDLQVEVDRLNEIVDHYLVLSRIRKPQKTRTHLQPFFKNLIDELSKKTNSSIKWEQRVQDDLSAEIDTDQFRRVFHNLKDNSLYAIQGKGTIQLTAFSEDNHIVIMFQDNGIGIPKDKMRGIFSAFVTHRTGGTGLGLYLAREIVEAHQGSISIESEPGKGTAVIIFLPLPHTED